MSIIDAVKNVVGVTPTGTAKAAPPIALKLTEVKRELAAVMQRHGAAALASLNGDDGPLAKWTTERDKAQTKVETAEAAYRQALLEDQKAEAQSAARKHETDVRRCQQFAGAWVKEMMRLQSGLENFLRAFREADQLGEKYRQACLTAGLPWEDWSALGNFSKLREAVSVETYRTMAMIGYSQNNVGEFPGGPKGPYRHNEIASMPNLQQSHYFTRDGQGNLPGTQARPGLSWRDLKDLGEMARAFKDRASALITGKELVSEAPFAVPHPIAPGSDEASSEALLYGTPTQQPVVTQPPTTDQAPDMPAVAPLDQNAVTPKTLDMDFRAALNHDAEKAMAYLKSFDPLASSYAQIGKEHWSELDAGLNTIIDGGTPVPHEAKP